ncbi:MAG TPA: spore germination protein GerW family protein [Mycobacteriales bacterium]|nr:spore germination protein GerW family protein [Mycobacteriales bacterium]
MSEGPQLVDRLAEAATVRRAFGDPIERDGALVIPVARIVGGGGGGEGGRTGDSNEQGSGGGFGLRVTPAGVFVIKDGAVTWQPAFDQTRVILGGQLIGVVALLVARSVLRRRARRAR